MKILSVMILACLTALGLAGCSGGASTNPAADGNTLNSNGQVTSSGSNAMNSGANMDQSKMGRSNVNTVNSAPSSTGASTDINSFMVDAARAGITEVEMGRLAEKRAENAEVKKFAQKMVQDHSNANTELKQLAAQKNVTLPTGPDTLHKLLTDKLSSLSGAEFDKEYMRAQVDDHGKAVALFQSQADLGTDTDAKAWAAKILPNLKAHLEMARDISGKLK